MAGLRRPGLIDHMLPECQQQFEYHKGHED